MYVSLHTSKCIRKSQDVYQKRECLVLSTCVSLHTSKCIRKSQDACLELSNATHDLGSLETRKSSNFMN